MAIRVCQLYGVSVDAFTVDGPLETIDYKRFMTSPLAPFTDSGLWQGPGPEALDEIITGMGTYNTYLRKSGGGLAFDYEIEPQKVATHEALFIRLTPTCPTQPTDLRTIPHLIQEYDRVLYTLPRHLLTGGIAQANLVFVRVSPLQRERRAYIIRINDGLEETPFHKYIIYRNQEYWIESKWPFYGALPLSKFIGVRDEQNDLPEGLTPVGRQACGPGDWMLTDSVDRLVQIMKEVTG